MNASGTTERAGFSRPEILVIAACAISMLIVQMDWFALNLALPAIAREFEVPTTDLQWVVSGYMLSIGALMITGGRLADIFGRRNIIVLGLIGLRSSVRDLRRRAQRDMAHHRPRRARRGRSTHLSGLDRGGLEHVHRARARAVQSALSSASQRSVRRSGHSSAGTFSEYLSWRWRVLHQHSVLHRRGLSHAAATSRTRETRPPTAISTWPECSRSPPGWYARPRVRQGRELGLGARRRRSEHSSAECCCLRCSSLIESRVRSPFIDLALLPQPGVRCGAAGRIAFKHCVLLRRGVLSTLPAAGAWAVAIRLGVGVPRALRGALAPRATSRAGSRSAFRPTG